MKNKNIFTLLWEALSEVFTIVSEPLGGGKTAMTGAKDCETVVTEAELYLYHNCTIIVIKLYHNCTIIVP